MTNTSAIQALNTLTDLPWQEGYVAADQTNRVHFEGELSPAQYDRIAYLYENAGVKCKIAVKPDSPEVMGVLDEFDSNRLQALASQEENRRANGPKVAELLGSITGITWQWDGLRPITTEAVYDSPNYQLTDKLNELAESGAVKWNIRSLQHGDRTDSGHLINHSHASVSEFDIGRLEQIAEQSTGPKRADGKSWVSATPKSDFGIA